MNTFLDSLKKVRVENEFFRHQMDDISEQSLKYGEDSEEYQKWYNEEFRKFVKLKGYENLFDESNEVLFEEVKAEDIPVALLEVPEVVTVEPEEVVKADKELNQTMENLKSVVSKVADSLQSEGIIEPKKPVKQGLIFDHLVVKDPEAAAAVDNGAHSIKVEEGPIQRTLFDNSQIISKFPDMGRIQDIIRTTNGWDVEMLPLYDDFVICTLYENGVVTNKVFIVDYKGHFMNNLPKIFLIKGGFIDESEAIHLSDALNLINYLKGVKITQPQEQIVTPEQRKIAKYIVNYGTPLVHDRFKNKFESICIEKVIPFIEGMILPQHPDASFAIDTFKDSTHWALTCTPNVPYRFGESGGTCKSTIYIHASGLDKDGHILVTPTFG